MDSAEHIVVGAGPSGLRAAQVLADAGREVLVLEKNARVGPKTCGGALSRKAVLELEALGLPTGSGIASVARASFRGEPAIELDPHHARIVTLSRERLGRHQLEWSLAAGAEVQTGAAVTRLDLERRTLNCGGRQLAYRYLIGADGSGSVVRRALGIGSPRAFFAGEYNVPGRRATELGVAFDSKVLASGYFWVFPHEEHLCIGAGGHKLKVRPSSVRPYIDRKAAQLAIELGETPYEGAAVEVDFRGFAFGGGVYLCGDAAGVPSGLTAEGIYPALITGEEVARRILEPSYPMTKTRAWMRIKRAHDALGRLWLREPARELSLSGLQTLSRRAAGRRWLSAFFLTAS